MFAGQNVGPADVRGADCRLREYSPFLAVDAFGAQYSSKFKLQLDSELERESKSEQEPKPKPKPKPKPESSSEPKSGSEPESKLWFDIRGLAIEQF
jgi:hypothetical protein